MTRHMLKIIAGAALLAGSCTAALAVDNLLSDPGFEGPPVGAGWGSFGAAGFNAFFGTDAHASLFGDNAANTGGFFQAGLLGIPGRQYQLTLMNTRIEANWDADAYAGFEYYAADDATKLGETLTALDTATRLANGQTEGNVFSVTATAVPGTAYVRPIVRFDNVNPGYSGQTQANLFVFDSFLSYAPRAGSEALKNPRFLDLNADGSFGDYWGNYGNTGFNEFFGAGNPHASFFADTMGNTGSVYQQGILATPGKQYRFDLANTRIELYFAADLYYGLEYYAADDFTKLGEDLVFVDTTTTGDGLAFRMFGTAVPGAVYVRPIIRFENVYYDGGTDRNLFVFRTGLTEVGPNVNLLLDPGFEGPPRGNGWGKWGATDFNSYWGNNAHASFYADRAGNVGGVFQPWIPGQPGVTYKFDLLDTRIEANWDATFLFGFEYYASDNATKLGETLVPIDAAARLANGSIDANVFSMTGTAVPGTALVRPIMKFENVNPAYNGQPQANLFVFDTYAAIAPAAGDEYLKNPGFDDLNYDDGYGDYWRKWGTVDFNAFFGGNDGHASFFADTIGNAGGVWQQGILGTPGTDYAFELTNVRIEANWDAELYFGLEYYGADDYTKLGETIALADTATPGDGLKFSMIGRAVPGTVYVRPGIRFDNVGTTGGELRNAFVFASTLTELAPQIPGDYDRNGVVNAADLAGWPGCMRGPGVNPGDAQCLAALDFNADQDVDLADFRAFQLAVTAP